MRTVYSTTCPQFHDTKAIAKAKWLQVESGNGNGVRTDRSVVYPTTDLKFHDTKLDVLEKILQENCEAPEQPTIPDVLTDLLAYWKMEEGGTTPKQDSHTGNHDLSTNGTNSPSVTGKILNGSQVSGSPGAQLINPDADFGAVGAMTMAGWFKFASLDELVYLVGKQDLALAAPGTYTEGYMLYLNASGKFAFWQGDSAATAEAEWPTIPAIGEWYFVVCGFDGTNIFIQVNNGSRQQQAGITPTVSPLDFEFGGTKGLGVLAGPNMIVDEFGFWFNRALTTTEAEYLYNSSSGRTYPFT